MESYEHKVLRLSIASYVRKKARDFGGTFKEVTANCGLEFTPDFRAWITPTYGPQIEVLGEAETSNSIENKHAVAQAEAFFKYIHLKGAGQFVVAVPVEAMEQAHEVYRPMARRYGFDSYFAKWDSRFDFPVGFRRYEL